jgi:hypothetical protein
MGVRNGGAGRLAPLALALALPACAALDVSPPWAPSSATAPEDSLTVQRVVGAEPEVQPLLPEGGNVWPAAEAPRATLADPEAAMRDVPEYTPRIPPPRPEAQPRRQPRGSSTPPQTELPPTRDFRYPSPLAQPPLSPPPPRADGQVIPLPGGGAAVTTGGTERYQTFTEPGGGSGIAIPDGATTTLIGPDGRVRVVPRQR